MNIASQNNGALDTGKLLLTLGEGNHSGGVSGTDGLLTGESRQPFSRVLSKMMNKTGAMQSGTSSDVRASGAAMVNGSGSVGVGEGDAPAAMLSAKGHESGWEKGEKLSDVFGQNLTGSGKSLDPSAEGDGVLEVDLQTLLNAIQSLKGTGESDADTADPADAASVLSSLLQSLIAKLSNQGGAVDGVEDSVAAASGQEATALGLQAANDAALALINNGLALEQTASSEETARGNKVSLMVPPELLKNFVLNKNGQPHFAKNGAAIDSETTVPSDEGVVDAAGQSLSSSEAVSATEEPTFRLVRLNTQASSSSPQGALLAAVSGQAKTSPEASAVLVTDNADPGTGGTMAVNASQQETFVKNAGESRVRDMLLNPKAADAADKMAFQTGSDIQEGVDAEAADEVQSAVAKGVNAFDEVVRREEKVKNAPILSGKESTQWVPLSGATSPQVSPETGTALKGVFIPMDRVLQEAGAVLEKGAGKVQMTLQPPSLGTINMEVVVQNNRVDLVLTANHADVQQLLQANSDQLKNALNNQGFQIDQMSVLLKREGFNFNLGGNPLWQERAGEQSARNSGADSSATTPETEWIHPRNDYGTGTISIFA